jgi:hypothetical protein
MNVALKKGILPKNKFTIVTYAINGSVKDILDPSFLIS